MIVVQFQNNIGSFAQGHQIFPRQALIMLNEVCYLPAIHHASRIARRRQAFLLARDASDTLSQNLVLGENQRVQLREKIGIASLKLIVYIMAPHSRCIFFQLQQIDWLQSCVV